MTVKVTSTEFTTLSLFLLRSLAHTAPAAAAAAIGVFDFRLTFTDPLWDWTAKVPGNTKESSKVSLAHSLGEL